MISNELLAAAWGYGELSYKLRNIQKKVRQDWQRAFPYHQKYYIECTRRFGKSTLLLVILSEHCLKNPGAKAGYYAPVKEGLKDYVVPIIDKVFDDCPDEMRPILDSHLTLTFANGSTIIFRGSNNQQHRIRRGNDLQIAAIDEARDVDDLDNLIDSVVVPSLFTSSGRLVISSTPADTDDHPLHAYRQAAEKEGWFSHYDIYQANRYDPEDFPLERIEAWKKETKDQVAWEREYMARWVKDPTKTIIPEWGDGFVASVPRNEFFTYYHKYVSMDLGVKDKTAAIFGYYDFKEAKLIIESEFVLQDSEVLTDNIANLVKATEAALGYQLVHDKKDDKYKMQEVHERVFRRVADNNNPLLMNDLNALYGLDFFGTRKDELPAMINQTREWIKDGRIIVNPECKELIGCLRNAIWDKNKRELARSKVYGHFDALMALVYLVRNIDTQSNPIPKYYGKTWETHAIPPTVQQPQTPAYQLARMFKFKTDRDMARDNFTRGRS